jgi:hypothetical protein
MSAPERITFYRRQMAIGNLQILCRDCNLLKGDLQIDIWRSAVQQMHAAAAPRRLGIPPAGGTLWTPEQKRQWLRRWLSTHIWPNLYGAAS